jgi:hypothetical protein
MEAIRFRPNELLAQHITERNEYIEESNNNTIARRDLQRYYLLMQNTKMPLSEKEFQACLAASLSTLFDSDWGIRFFPVGIIESCEIENLHEEYGLEKDAFVAKLQALSLFERCVVVDAIERERVKILRENLGEA